MVLPFWLAIGHAEKGCGVVGVGGLGRHYAVDVLRHAELCSVSVDHFEGENLCTFDGVEHSSWS